MLENNSDGTWRIIQIRLPYGEEVMRLYDAADRLIAETHVEKSTGIHNTMRFAYDMGNNLTAVQDNRGGLIRFEYNLLDQDIRKTKRDGGITRTFYDLNGNTLWIIRPNEYQASGEQGKGEEYAYDLMGRRISVIWPDGILREENAYNAEGLLFFAADRMYFWGVKDQSSPLIYISVQAP